VKKKDQCPHCLGTGQVQDQELVGLIMRNRRKLSLRATARCIGVSPSHLCLLEQGKRKWTPELVRKYKQCCQ